MLMLASQQHTASRWFNCLSNELFAMATLSSVNPRFCGRLRRLLVAGLTRFSPSVPNALTFWNESQQKTLRMKGHQRAISNGVAAYYFGDF